MKKLLAVVLSLALAFPAASLLAQQAPAKQQPVQTAQAGAAAGGLFGLGVGATVAIIAVAMLAVVSATDDDDTLPPAAAAASGTR